MSKTIDKSEQEKQWACGLSLLSKKKSHEARRLYDETCAKIFNRYNRSLSFYFMKRGSSQEESADLAISVIQKAFEKIEMYDPNEGNFSTWIYKIAYNAWVDEKRRSLRSGGTMLSIDEERSVDKGNDEEVFFMSNVLKSDELSPEDELLKEERMAILMSMVKSLKSPDQKQAMLLRYRDELSYDEISDQMGIKLNRVKTLLFRAKASLQKKFHAHKEQFLD